MSRIGNMFLTVKILEDTPAVLSLGRLCKDHGYSFEWTSGQKPCLIKMVFGYNAIRKTTFQSSSQGDRRLLLRQARLEQHLQHHHLGKVQAQHLFPASVECESADEKERGDPSSNPTKIPKPNKKRTTTRKGDTPFFPNCLDGCKNSEKILWMKEFPRTEIHTRVLLMSPLQSRRDERYWAIIVFTRTSRKTETAKSARGLELQGLVEDVLVKS